MPFFEKSEEKDRCDFMKLGCAFGIAMSGVICIAINTMVDALEDLGPQTHSNDNQIGHAVLGKTFNAADMEAKLAMLSGEGVSLWCEKNEGGSRKVVAPSSESEFSAYLRRGCYVAADGGDPSHPGRVIYPKLDVGLK